MTLRIAFAAAAVLAGPLLHATVIQVSQPAPDYLAATTLLSITAPPQSFVTSISDGTLTVSFSNSGSPVVMDVDTVPDSWATWGSPADTESATPTVLAPDDGPLVTSLLFQFDQALSVFGVELEPDDTSASHQIAAEYFLGGVSQGVISIDVSGNAGARLFAAEGAFFDSVMISSDVDFGSAEFRYALAPEPCGVWLVGLACAAGGVVGRRAQRSKSAK